MIDNSLAFLQSHASMWQIRRCFGSPTQPEPFKATDITLKSCVNSSDLGVGVAIGIGIEFYLFFPDTDTDTDPDTDGNKAKSFFLDQSGIFSASGGALVSL